MSENPVLSASLTALPVDLQAHATPLLTQLQSLDLALLTPPVADTLLKVCCCSQFVFESLTRQPSLFADLVESGDLLHGERGTEYADALVKLNPDSEAALAKSLRLFRRREMVRIAWRDLAGWATLDETLSDLTALAEACIQTALAFLYEQACRRWGTPTLANGEAFNLVVLGMGKLGAFELNYSSDIDLICAYAEDGVLTEKKEIAYSEFFTRICRSLVKMLDEITVDGFVFRTDLRLRPFGDSGPLVMSFDGMENYYLTQAREWERYAMVKARQVAGDVATGKQLAALIKPFVYRRYLDYGAFDELRSLKSQINQELRRKDRMENVKLGPGGIREIEFIGQAFQLIRGGQQPALQQREIQHILTALARLKLMTQADVETLQTAYRFLRRVENHIQQYQDKQTHDLPTDARVQCVLAYSLDFADWGSFKAALDATRQQVQAIFDQVFSLSAQDKPHDRGQLIWQAQAEQDDALEALADLGFCHPKDSLAALQAFKSDHAIRHLSSKGAAVLERLMPQLLGSLTHVADRDVTLTRLLQLLNKVAGRNVYLSLLAENPEALKQLVTLVAASAWIGEYLAQYPVLFDELLDTRSLYEPLQKQALTEDLQRLLSRIETQDSEQLMIALRQFKHLNILRVAAADIMDVIPLMVVSDYLTYIAEAILEQVVFHAWQMLGDKHGYPPHTSAEQVQGFGVVGFGKFGGIELGYGSDLDLVFLTDYADGDAMTEGGKAIGSAQFYLRLGQKVRHILDTKLLSGALYEVDLRLRPSGDSGLLVTHLDSYEAYLTQQAWTWEHQALVRARFVAGDRRLQPVFEGIRARVLALPRDYAALKVEVREMREKMREHLASKQTDVFDLKQSTGGIADIEFLVQFGILAESANHPALMAYTDNVRLLAALQQHGFMSASDALFLKKAYCQYRDYGHRQVLQGHKALADADEFADIRERVIAIWRGVMD